MLGADFLSSESHGANSQFKLSNFCSKELFSLNPNLQIHDEVSQEINPEGMKTLLEKMHFRNKIKKAVLEFKRSELTGEIFTKLTVQTLLLLLSYTSTPTTSGLETVFDEDLQSSLINNQVLLAFSLIFSFKTTLSTFVDIRPRYFDSRFMVLDSPATLRILE